MEWLSNLWSGIQDLFSTAIDWVVGVINSLLGGLAEFIFGFLNEMGLEIEIPPNVFDALREISIGVGYIIPVKELLPIPIFMISFYILKLIFSIYQLIAGTVIKRTRLKL